MALLEQVFIAPYMSSFRMGTLLKYQMRSPSGEEVVYSDYFPWAEFGELSVEELVRQMKIEKALPEVLQANLSGAQRIQGLLRQELNYLEEPVQSHFLVLDWMRGVGLYKLSESHIIKIKALPQQASALVDFIVQSPCRVRLDFNGRWSVKAVEDFLRSLGEHVARVDLIEDPCPFDSNHWREMNQIVPVFIDWEPFPRESADWPFSGVVYKPLIQHRDWIEGILQNTSLEVLVTSKRDHPLGVLWAHLEYLQLKKEFGPMKIQRPGLTADHALKEKSPLGRVFEMTDLQCTRFVDRNKPDLFKFLSDQIWEPVWT